VLGVPVFALGGVWPFLSFLLPFCLLPFLSGWGLVGRGRGNSGGRVRVEPIGHGVGVGVETKAREGGGKKC
jgi:hypothetical protein